MAAEKPFLVPVVIDGINEADARVPDRFREVQWTRLPDGETPPEFVQRIRRLLVRARELSEGGLAVQHISQQAAEFFFDDGIALASACLQSRPFEH
jgi:hypothetical protein